MPMVHSKDLRDGAAPAQVELSADLGGKALGLARLVRQGLRVPPFFVATPDISVEAIERAWSAAGWSRVAVRSSAVSEDGVAHSFAGMFESILGVEDAAGLQAAVARCRQSGSAERVQAYLKHHQLSDVDVAGSDAGAQVADLRVSVVVQELVEGECSGVMFSRDPMRPDHTLISAAWGLGEGVVQGAVPCDTVHVAALPDSAGTHAVQMRLGHKSRAVQMVDGHPVEVDTPDEQHAVPCLSNAQARELADMGRRLEAVTGVPQDVEWTCAGGRLVMLQTRPITQPIPKGRPLLWDNANIIESYYGPTSPLTYSFASHAYTIVYQLFCEVMGVDRQTVRENSAVFPRMIGYIRGRIFYNLNAWYQVVAMLPGYRWNRGFMEQMMGVTEVGGLEVVPDAPGSRLLVLPKLIRTGLGMAWRVLRLDHDVANFSAEFDDAVGKHSATDFDQVPPHRLLEVYSELERRLLWAWSTPIVNDFFVMVFFGLLRSLCEKWVGVRDNLHNALVAGEGGMESTAPTRQALKLASRLRGSKDQEVFAADSDEAAWQAAQNVPWLREALHAWIEKYGDRCADELKLEVPSIRQEPERLMSILRAYLDAPPVDPTTDAVGSNHETRLRQEAERKVALTLTGLRFWVFNWVLAQARQRVRDRENLRFLRTRIFGLVRRIFRSLGTHMVTSGAIRERDDIFFLTVDEAFGWVRGTSPTVDTMGLVQIRKDEQASFENEPEPADRFTTWGPVWAHNQFMGQPAVASQPEGGLLGLGAFPGVVEGRVRLIVDPKQVASLDGDILVTYRTDPGWVPLFPTASAILVERGSLLSHSAVVAREMGIPTIVGIAGLMDTLKTGDVVKMDGAAGTIEICSGPSETEGEE